MAIGREGNVKWVDVSIFQCTLFILPFINKKDHASSCEACRKHPDSSARNRGEVENTDTLFQRPAIRCASHCILSHFN